MPIEFRGFKDGSESCSYESNDGCMYQGIEEMLVQSNGNLSDGFNFSALHNKRKCLPPCRFLDINMGASNLREVYSQFLSLPMDVAQVYIRDQIPILHLEYFSFGIFSLPQI